MEWQPIETAPKDGTDIIAYFPDAYEKIDIVRWEQNQYHGDSWAYARCVDGLQTSENATHWMPLPPPPVK